MTQFPLARQKTSKSKGRIVTEFTENMNALHKVNPFHVRHHLIFCVTPRPKCQLCTQGISQSSAMQFVEHIHATRRINPFDLSPCSKNIHLISCYLYGSNHSKMKSIVKLWVVMDISASRGHFCFSFKQKKDIRNEGYLGRTGCSCFNPLYDDVWVHIYI